MINKYISHPQDKIDAQHELEKLKYPYRLFAIAQKPTHGTGLEKWRAVNSFFHRGVCKTYSDLSGLDEKEAKSDLQVRYACVIENKDDFEVESVGGMNLSRLIEFTDACVDFLILEYGTRADELLSKHRTGKTKKIQK